MCLGVEMHEAIEQEAIAPPEGGRGTCTIQEGIHLLHALKKGRKIKKNIYKGENQRRGREVSCHKHEHKC